MSPELFEIVTHTGKGIEGLPEPNLPYYVLAKEGMFLHRHTQIGNVLVKQTKQPPTLGELGFANGVFNWIGPKIPAKIISQAYDFFRRVYATHHTEAEVLITMHNETGEFRLFVPFQRTNYSGVKSIYEPTHVHKDYTVVGTLHSHCNFTAFHSGTDSADASDMDGVHFTLGHVDQDPPQIVAMVAMNGKEFHYNDPATIAELDFHADTAPAWWDQYVFPHGTGDTKPKSLKSITQEQWDEYRGIIAAKKVHHYQSHGPSQPYQYRGTTSDDAEYDFWSQYAETGRYSGYNRAVVPFQPTRESQQWNRKQERKRKKADRQHGHPSYPTPVWGKGGELKNNPLGITDEQRQIDAALDLAIERFVFNDDDWSLIAASDLDEMPFWKEFFSDRLGAVAEVLEMLGMKVTLSVKEPTPDPNAPLPGQMSMEQVVDEAIKEDLLP